MCYIYIISRLIIREDLNCARREIVELALKQNPNTTFEISRPVSLKFDKDGIPEDPLLKELIKGWKRSASRLHSTETHRRWKKICRKEERREANQFRNELERQLVKNEHLDTLTKREIAAFEIWKKLDNGKQIPPKGIKNDEEYLVQLKKAPISKKRLNAIQEKKSLEKVLESEKKTDSHEKKTIDHVMHHAIIGAIIPLYEIEKKSNNKNRILYELIDNNNTAKKLLSVLGPKADKNSINEATKWMKQLPKNIQGRTFIYTYNQLKNAHEKSLVLWGKVFEGTNKQIELEKKSVVRLREDLEKLELLQESLPKLLKIKFEGWDDFKKILNQAITDTKNDLHLAVE